MTLQNGASHLFSALWQEAGRDGKEQARAHGDAVVPTIAEEKGSARLHISADRIS